MSALSYGSQLLIRLTCPSTLRNEAAFSLERMIRFQRDTDWILLRTSSLDLILSSWSLSALAGKSLLPDVHRQAISSNNSSSTRAPAIPQR
ncbi:hypothetical protein C8J56DRAFT_1064407 [Mycena floridula]|nr:hypothetical protein C8J56DRAFT_1064407 [Mycena floridula]